MASGLSKGGYKVKVWDCIAENISVDALNEKLYEWKPNFIFLNTSTPTFSYDVKTAEEIKKKIPKVFLIAFGVHVSVSPNEIIKDNPAIDAVISGEPEVVAFKIADEASAGTKNFTDIPGLATKSQSIKKNPSIFCDNLDSLGIPAWEFLPIKYYIHPVFNKPYLIINTSRGCPQRCIFCVGHIFYGYKVRYRSVESIIEEIKLNIEKFDVRHFWFYADDFTYNPGFVKELCRGIIKDRLNITWWSNTRVDCLDREMFNLMAEAGCSMLSIGGESGDEDMLNRMRKRTTPDQITQTVKLLRESKIISLVYFIFGLPGETKKSITNTIKFAIQLNPDFVEFYPAIPFPGTEFYCIAIKENMITVDSYDYFHNDGKNAVVKVNDLYPKDINSAIGKAYRRFYFRPMYLFTLFKNFPRLRFLSRLMSFGISYFKILAREKG